MTHRFGDLELDETLYQLRRGGRVVKTEPRVFDVLAYLLQHRDRVVSKNELLDALWPGEAVSESVLPRCIAAARRAVGDDRKGQRVIQTVHGRGYRFVADLDSAAQDADPSAAATADAAPFVGRDAVMERLEGHLERAARGAGRVVLIAGEPGIGKTRTAEEIAAVARRAGFQTFQARGFEGESAPAFWSWTQLLRAAIARNERAALLAAAGRGAADVAALVPEMPTDRAAGDPKRGEGEQARFRIFDSIGQLLVGLSAHQPLVLILDDLHWADADSLLLLEFLAPRMRAASILLVGAYRDVDVRRDHALAATLANLAREDHCERLELRGLDPSAVESMMTSVAGVAPAPELAASVGQMTDGNPFFVRELTRLLDQEGRLDDALESDGSLALPQGVRDVIGRRLDKLSDDCNEMLRAAAVLGRDFGVPLLERICGDPRERLLEWIQEALAARILLEASEAGRYDFVHALVRQTLYMELSAARRIALHRDIANALEQAYGKRVDDHLAELAYHSVEAAPLGGVDRAVDYCARAGERAQRQYAYEEAARHYARALEAIDLDLDPNDVRRCELVLALGETLLLGGVRERSRERCREAADLARALGRWDLFGRAALAYRGIGEGGTAYSDGRSLLEEALERLGDDGDASTRARLLSKLVQTPPYWESLATREKLSLEAYALAKRSGDEEARVDALASRWWACLGPDRLDERAEVARELVAGPHGDEPRTRMLALEVMRGLHLTRGELADARRNVEQHVELADEIRQPQWRFLAETNRASLAISLGEFERAQALIRGCPDLGRGTVRFVDGIVTGLQYMLHSVRGDELDLDQIERLGELSRHFGLVSRLIDASVLQWKLRLGQEDELRPRYEELVAADFADFERDENWLVVMRAFAELAGLLGDRARAARIHALIEPYADLFVSHALFGVAFGSVASLRGALALTLDRLDEAIAHGEKAERREAEAGLAPALLWTRSRLATALERRAGPGDAARARVLRDRVERDAAAIGSRHDYREGAAL